MISRERLGNRRSWIWKTRTEPGIADNSQRSRRKVLEGASPHPARYTFPEFPQEAYVGILAEFAELYSRHYESPKEFFYFSATMVAAVAMSGRVHADLGDLESYPRLYGFKIGPSGVSKKTAADKIAWKFITGAIADATGDALMTGNKAEAERNALQVLSGVGSGEGLAVSLTRHTRVLVVFDEFEWFLQKAGAEGSILGSVVNELFDSVEFSNVTRDRETVLKNAHLGFLTNMPLQQFEEMSGVKQLVDIGLWNRFMFVVGTRRHKCPVPTAPDSAQVAMLTARLAAAFSKLPVGNQPELVLRWTDEARDLWSRTEDVIGLDENATRLDEIGARLLAVFTVTGEKTEIDAETVRAVFAFLKYQRRVRELYKPSQAETKEAAIEGAILKQLKQRGPLTARQLSQHTHAHRYGIEKFQAALKALSGGEGRQVKKVEGAEYQLIEE